MAHLGYPRCVESPRGRCYTCGAVCGSDDRPSGVTIKELPAELRPRERLRSSGAGSLSTAELLALVLGTGTRQATALEVGATLLGRFRSVGGLAQASLEELIALPGAGEAKAARVRAAGRLMGIEILDHIIIGDRAFVSLREQRQGFP